SQLLGFDLSTTASSALRLSPRCLVLAAVDDSQASLGRRRLFGHIIVSPFRTGVGWIVHEPSAVTKLRLLHDHPAAPIKRDRELARGRAHKYSKRLGVFCAQRWSTSSHCSLLHRKGHSSLRHGGEGPAQDP